MNKDGLLIVFSGPSGAGKDTILNALLKKEPNLKLSISATTRMPREGEQDGENYYFLTKEQFLAMKERGEMLESAEYCGNYYGTPKSPIDGWIAQGHDVILEIEIQGGSQIKKTCPGCVSMFILPPSVRELERRLRDRGTETDEVIRSRLKVASSEISEAKHYDYIVINDTVHHAVEEIQCIISAEKHKVCRNSKTIEGVLDYD